MPLMIVVTYQLDDIVASTKVAKGEAGLYTLLQLNAKLRPRQHCANHCQLHLHEAGLLVVDSNTYTVSSRHSGNYHYGINGHMPMPF